MLLFSRCENESAELKASPTAISPKMQPLGKSRFQNGLNQAPFEAQRNGSKNGWPERTFILVKSKVHSRASNSAFLDLNSSSDRIPF